jgi:hypothetical protein
MAILGLEIIDQSIDILILFQWNTFWVVFLLLVIKSRLLARHTRFDSRSVRHCELRWIDGAKLSQCGLEGGGEGRGLKGDKECRSEE